MTVGRYQHAHAASTYGNPLALSRPPSSPSSSSLSFLQPSSHDPLSSFHCFALSFPALLSRVSPPFCSLRNPYAAITKLGTLHRNYLAPFCLFVYVVLRFLFFCLFFLKYSLPSYSFPSSSFPRSQFVVLFLSLLIKILPSSFPSCLLDPSFP